MSIDETLKDNLIADVENILDIQLTPNEDAALARCFEITIGHHFNLQPVTAKTEEETNDPEVPVISEKMIRNSCDILACHYELSIDDIKAAITNYVNGKQQPERVSAEEILEDELNEVGYSFKEQLKPDDIPIKIVKKVNKAIIKAMHRFASQHPIEQERLPLKNMKQSSFESFYKEQEKPSEAISKEEITEQSAEDVLRDELSEYYWDIITKRDEEGHTTFKDWIIEAMDRYASQKHLPTDAQVNEYLNNITGDAYRWRIQEFWQWVKSNIK